MKLWLTNAFTYFAILSQLIALLVNRICFSVFFFFFFLQCMVLQVCVLLPWGELEHCAYAVCYTMVTRAKHQNIQHAKALYKIDQ